MSIRLSVDNNYVTVLDPLPRDVVEALADHCSYMVDGAYFSPLYQSGKWDGRKRLFNRNSYKFPSGLLPEILKEGIIPNPEVLDVRAKPRKRIESEWVFPYPLRDYQESAVDLAVRYQRGVLNICTGGGKTVTAMRIAHLLGVKTLVIVNTKEAFKDTVDAYNACIKGDTVGMWGSGKKVFGRFVTVATMASVVKAFDSRDHAFIDQNFQCVFFDESHHLGSDTWHKAAQTLNAFYKYGLTGTNFRHGGSKILLRATTGKTLIEIKAKDLQAKGQLAQCEIVFLDVEEPFNLDRPMDYKELYEIGIVNNEVRNRMILRLMEHHVSDVKLVTVESVEHGELLLAEAKKIDKDAVFVHGKSKNRDEIKDMFVAGKLRTVIATRIYNESADIPILKVVINAAGGKSGNAVLQRLGRQLRLHESKDGSRMYDFRDLFNYKMEQHSMERIKWLKKEGHAVKTMLLSTLLSSSFEKPSPKKVTAKKAVKKRTKSG